MLVRIFTVVFIAVFVNLAEVSATAGGGSAGGGGVGDAGRVGIRGVCANRKMRVAKFGDSCGIPDFVDVDEFGDNMDTTGKLFAYPMEDGLELKIRLEHLPKPDLVLTAWLVWVPGGVTEPEIFEVANHAAPCAPFDAMYGTGFGRDPNEFVYRADGTSATLHTRLNFNPTFDKEGPLTRETFCYQKDVPGIQDTALEQYATPEGVFIPTSSDYLRMYDPETGFEKLMDNGDPMIMRSPVRAMGVEVIAHVDKTTHGISQGVGGADHYFVIFFPFKESIGERSM